jgi:hypothetical protein
MDPIVLDYFYNNYSRKSVNIFKKLWYSIGRGCPVCSRDDLDEEYFFNHYIPKIKDTPMFMNSPNKDPDF